MLILLSVLYSNDKDFSILFCSLKKKKLSLAAFFLLFDQSLQEYIQR